MPKAGIRQIRENLTRYLRRVARNHEEIVITDREQPIARLVPVAEPANRLRSRQALRASLTPRGTPLSELVVQARNDERA
jgi:prevent-host-death family protein